MSISIKKNGIITGSSSGINENMILCTPDSYVPNNYNVYTLSLNINMVLGEVYTIQFWDVDISHTGKTSSSLNVSIYWDTNGMNHEISFNVPTGHADYLCGTFTSRRHQTYSTGPKLVIYNSPQYADGDKYLHIGKWKLEPGSIPTPFSYSSADTEYTGNHVFIEDPILPAKFGSGYTKSTNIIEI